MINTATGCTRKHAGVSSTALFYWRPMHVFWCTRYRCMFYHLYCYCFINSIFYLNFYIYNSIQLKLVISFVFTGTVLWDVSDGWDRWGKHCSKNNSKDGSVHSSLPGQWNWCPWCLGSKQKSQMSRVQMHSVDLRNFRVKLWKFSVTRKA